MLLREEGVLHDRFEGATWPRCAEDLTSRIGDAEHLRALLARPASSGPVVRRGARPRRGPLPRLPREGDAAGISADYRFGKVYFCESTAGKVYMVKADDATSVEVVAEIPGAFDVVIDVVTTGDAITSMYVSSPTDNCIYKARIEGSDVVIAIQVCLTRRASARRPLGQHDALLGVGGLDLQVNLPSGVMAPDTISQCQVTEREYTGHAHAEKHRAVAGLSLHFLDVVAPQSRASHGPRVEEPEFDAADADVVSGRRVPRRCRRRCPSNFSRSRSSTSRG